MNGRNTKIEYRIINAWFYMNYIYRISKEEYEKALKEGAESIISKDIAVESAEVFEVYGDYFLKYTKKG